MPDIGSAIIIALLTSLLLWLFRAKVKLLYGSTNWSLHETPPLENGPRGIVSSEKIYVQNVGKKAAERVEIILRFKPFSYTIYPPRQYEENEMHDGKFALTIPSLASAELLIIDILSAGDRAELLAVHCPDNIPQSIKFLPQRQFNKAILTLIGYLMIAGFVSTIYVLIRFLSWGIS